MATFKIQSEFSIFGRVEYPASVAASWIHIKQLLCWEMIKRKKSLAFAKINVWKLNSINDSFYGHLIQMLFFFLFFSFFYLCLNEFEELIAQGLWFATSTKEKIKNLVSAAGRDPVSGRATDL